MKFGVPWSVKGIRPEARETAKEAARRSGMPLGEWLNSVILQQAGDDDDEISYGEDMSSVHQRLDDITRRIEQFSRTSAAAYAPKPQAVAEPSRGDNDQIAQLIARLDRRLEQFVNLPRMMAPYAPAPMPMPQAAMARPAFPPAMPTVPAPSGLDRAVAEIAARQRSLNGQTRSPPAAPQQPQSVRAPQTTMTAPAAPPAQAPVQPSAQPMAPALMPVPTQDLSGLEEHLRQITDQIETLRRPGVEDAINALRGELSEIGHALNEAMPRRAIEAIEKQIQGLNQRIAEGRQAGNMADAGGLEGVEHGLAEVRDALRGLTPAENLVGFNEAVDGLAHKIDLIVAQKDPETLGQLEHAITTLREMTGHVASNEAIGRLAAQVQQLGEKVDHFSVAAGSSDALNNLEHRIAAISDALAERSQSGGTVPPRLEALVESLSDKIEQIQQSRGDNVAAGHLEDQIVALVQRLDASDSRLGHLEAIERGLADLLVHIEEMRANKNTNGLREEISPGVIELKNDIARTQNALDAVHGTLGIVVDRLAVMEKGIQGSARAHHPADPDTVELTQPIGRIAARAVNDAPPQAAPPPASAPRAMAPSTPPPAPPVPSMPAAAAPLQADRPAAPQTAPQAAPQVAHQPAPQAVQKTAPRAAPQSTPQVPQPAAASKRPPPAARLPINPNLPPDQPLEPGTGAPMMHASARIAASEAALGGARPAAATGPAGKSGFIAAARRAAQAAVETATPRAPRPEPIEADENEHSSLRSSMMKRVKSLFIAASIVAVVIGSIQIAGNVLDFGSSTQSAKITQAPDIDSADADRAGDNAPNIATPGTSGLAAPSNLTANTLGPLNPPMLQGYKMPATGRTAIIGQVPLSLYPAGQNMPSLLSPTMPYQSARAPAGDITGSISRQAKPRPPREAPAIPEAGRLPIAIGGTKLRSAAVAGDAAAAYEVAVRFAEGRGVAADPEEAARWYERAASKGLVPAQFRYASLLEKGQGVKKNLAQARRLYLAAAAKGHAKAMHNLAVLYAEGIDGKPDYATAVTWFRKAAQHGVGDSQYNLGVLCARGLGTDKDVAEAYKWFALAADQGDREAGKKRDEVAAHLDADALATVQQTVSRFAAEPQPHVAITVPAPRGGWDEASPAAPTSRGKTNKSNAESHARQAVSANMPLNVSEIARR
ncbi:MAG: hypothetical protein K9G60_16210 [Pseudolabrys sp.]|nr:hypothetical protein [Pseudolabrys sp.]